METFKQRRERILATFSQAKSDLETLNADIDAQINENNAAIAQIQSQNQELSALKTNNDSSIKVFAKFLK